MTNEQRLIISLLRKSLNQDEKIKIDENIDILSVERIIINNGILLTVYPTICTLSSLDYLKNRLYLQYISQLRQSAEQKHEGTRVLQALEKAGFDCMTLKGWNLRNLYPIYSMRQMVDIDILIRPYAFNKIKEIISNLGFDSGKESSWKHDNFTKEEVELEIHKRLTDDSGVIQRWEKRIWDRALSESEHIYKMSPEDFYIFHFIHLHKDFLNGSLGLRRIVDTWLLMNMPRNDELVTLELKSFNLETFRERMEKLARIVMGNEEMDDNSDVLLAHAFRYGIYGTKKTYKTGRIAAMSIHGDLRQGKLKSLIAAIFLPFSRMKAFFPIIERYPVLLPYYWCKRMGELLKKDFRMFADRLDYSEINEEDYQEMKIFFNAGGVGAKPIKAKDLTISRNIKN